MSTDPRPLPVITPETAHFWEGTRNGVITLQKCDACALVYFPPRPFCPGCGSREVATVASRGRGRLYSYVISHLPAAGFEPPYVIAVVELEEGPRLMTNIVGTPPVPESLPLDAAVQVVFETFDDRITLPFFELVN